MKLIGSTKSKITKDENAVKGLITKRFSPKCVNGKSSPERRHFVRQELTDLLLYPDART